MSHRLRKIQLMSKCLDKLHQGSPKRKHFQGRRRQEILMRSHSTDRRRRMRSQSTDRCRRGNHKRNRSSASQPLDNQSLLTVMKFLHRWPAEGRVLMCSRREKLRAPAALRPPAVCKDWVKELVVASRCPDRKLRKLREEANETLAAILEISRALDLRQQEVPKRLAERRPLVREAPVL